MSSTRNPALSRLTSRDRLIVEHVVRDRISTNEVIQQRFFDAAHPTSVTRVTARLCSLGWLASFPLIYPTRYFVPGKLSASAYGLPASRTLPLGPQSLPTDYAVLKYTSANDPQVQRLTYEEIDRVATWYQPEWMFHPHCMRHHESGGILELVRVDLGGPADHIARKCRDDIRLRNDMAEFQEFVKRGRFALVILTGSTAKAAMIQAALDHQPWMQGIVFRLSVFVSLIPLLPRSL